MKSFTFLVNVAGVMLFVVFACSCAPGAEPTSMAAGERVTIGTWNLEWLFDDNRNDNESDLAKEMSAENRAAYELRVRRMADVIAQIKPTVMALQEVESEKVVADLATALRVHHELKYKVGFVQGTDSFTEQDVAFLIEDRPGEMEISRIDARAEGLTDRGRYKVPSKHAVLTFTRSVGGETQRMVIVTAHLKAGANDSDEAQRTSQSRALNAYVSRRMREGSEVVVLGDFNAGKAFSQTSRRDAMGVLVGMETNATDDDLIDLNLRLPATFRRTHSTGRELDRIVVSPNLLDDRGLVLERVFNHRNDTPRGLSDHFPLTARFQMRP
ncbi:MAG: endonuclease/exonuclease/phosphatase family protein [Pirellulaceae bacterium]